MHTKEDTIYIILGIIYLFVVGTFGLYTCMEKEDAINRIESQHAQHMMTESCR